MRPQVEPLTSPYFFRASIAYWEQLGWNLHGARRKERADEQAVGVHERDRGILQAWAFCRTSPIRSSSQSKPRRLGRLRQPRPHDEHVVVLGARDSWATTPRGAGASSCCGSRTPPIFFGTATPSLGPLSSPFSRSNQYSTRIAGRDRATMTVNGVEVPRPGEAMAALHDRPLRGEPLPALGAAALEDRPPRARGHACPEAVLALPPAHVGLIGPLHERRMETERRAASGGAESV